MATIPTKQVLLDRIGFAKKLFGEERVSVLSNPIDEEAFNLIGIICELQVEPIMNALSVLVQMGIIDSIETGIQKLKESFKYSIYNLRPLITDIKAFVREFENLLESVLSEYGVDPKSDAALTWKKSQISRRFQNLGRLFKRQTGLPMPFLHLMQKLEITQKLANQYSFQDQEFISRGLESLKSEDFSARTRLAELSKSRFYALSTIPDESHSLFSQIRRTYPDVQLGSAEEVVPSLILLSGTDVETFEEFKKLHPEWKGSFLQLARKLTVTHFSSFSNMASVPQKTEAPQVNLQQATAPSDEEVAEANRNPEVIRFLTSIEFLTLDDSLHIQVRAVRKLLEAFQKIQNPAILSWIVPIEAVSPLLNLELANLSELNPMERAELQKLLRLLLPRYLDHLLGGAINSIHKRGDADCAFRLYEYSKDANLRSENLMQAHLKD